MNMHSSECYKKLVLFSISLHKRNTLIIDFNSIALLWDLDTHLRNVMNINSPFSSNKAYILVSLLNVFAPMEDHLVDHEYKFQYCDSHQWVKGLYNLFVAHSSWSEII